jgi:hypothetical protein
MVKVFIIIGLLLIFSGVPGLYWVSFENDQIQQKIEFCKAKYNRQVDEYIRNLGGESLSDADSRDPDAAAASDVEKMTPSQRLTYQQERLLADIDELAESKKSVPENADLLYGTGWRQKVIDYKNKKQLLATVQVSSVTAAIAGGVLLAAAFVFLIVRIIIGFIRWLMRLFGRKDERIAAKPKIKPVQEEKSVMPPTAVISNVSAPTVKAPNPTAEEFRRLLLAQTESIQQIAQQLKEAKAALRQDITDNNPGISEWLEKRFKSQAESVSQTTDTLKKLSEDIRNAVESQRNDLSKAMENSAVLHTDIIKNEIDKSLGVLGEIEKSVLGSQTDDLNNIKRQIADLSNDIHVSTESKKSDSTEMYEKIRQEINSQLQPVTKKISSLNEITDTINNKIEEYNNSKSEQNSQVVKQYLNDLNEIKQQISELANIINTSVAAEEPAQIEVLLNDQTQAVTKEIEFLKQTAEVLLQKCEEIKDSRPADIPGEQLSEDAQLLRQISEESLQKTDAITKNITDLTEQVCAIREYAAKQQEHLTKLQDGYDWNIIKNFCLRVIRCIDNLDDRISELVESGENTKHLLAVRDELGFILESNGVEPFGAKIGSDYRGQENRLQVLNERDETDETNLVGKIAQVVRPGYQCRVNDEFTKIVRPAHVRLYGSNCLSNVAVRGD